MFRIRSFQVTLFGCWMFFLLGSIPVQSAEPAKDAGPGQGNILVTATVTQAIGGKTATEESFEMVMGENIESKFVFGRRVPIPTTAVGSSEADKDNRAGSQFAFTYQNIGFIADCKPAVTEGRKIFLECRIEDSWLEPSSAADPPTIGTASWEVTVFLTPDEPLRLNRVVNGKGGVFTLTLVGHIAR